MSYDATTTTDEILDGADLAGRHFVITGASSGLGEETTRALCQHGARVSMLARNMEKLRAAETRVQERVPGARVDLHQVDLADLRSIRAFAAGFLEANPSFDVLINNAGVMCCPMARTTDGFEMQFGTNHVGHFLLTNLLMPALLKGAAPRVVNLSSAGHSICDVDLEDPNFEKTEYDPWDSYGRSKTANVLFTVELARRHPAPELVALAVHPGMIMTELGRHLTEETMKQMMERSAERAEASGQEATGGMSFKSVEAGAATQVWAATASELAGHSGAYLGDCQLGVAGGNPTGNGYVGYALDASNARALWALSEELVGESFPGAE